MIHPTSDFSPEPQARLWDEQDVRYLELMVEAVHRHGALAGVQLAHNGVGAQNLYTRMPPLAPSDHVGVDSVPNQGRGMTLRDIREFKRWHREAAIKAKRAGADVVYVYAGHDTTLLMHFLSRRRNQRSDEYGGCLENRARLFREVLLETKDAVGDRCAIAVRLAVDELLGPDGLTCQGEGREIVEMLAELPDLWDVNISDWENDSATSRFSEEGFQEPYVAFVKQVTTKPVVGVGRFTSPDTMVNQLNRGVLDMIGAARPSIADPFLPQKIEQGRIDEIRECIGCNICVSGQLTFTPMRCTQNPTTGEEWRRGWHAEKIAGRGSDQQILVVGAGPAGLEASRALGQRGYHVTLAESARELGGRVVNESQLPGLSAWNRVTDWRVGRIQQMPNVEVFLESRMGLKDILNFECDQVILATGASWRSDGIGISNWHRIEGSDQAHVFTPEHVFGDVAMDGPVVVFDDDNFYIGALIAEKLRRNGMDVTFVTSAEKVSPWTENTLEQHRIQALILDLGVTVVTSKNLAHIDSDSVRLSCEYTGKFSDMPASSVVLVTSRQPNNELQTGLEEEQRCNPPGVPRVITSIGDCVNPATIAAAVFDGHRVAQELDAPPDNPDMPFKREQILLA